MAVSLAAALGAVAPTCLVELGPAPGGVAALLRLDPAHNLALVAHTVATAGAVPGRDGAGTGSGRAGRAPGPTDGPMPGAPVWGRAIEQEAQALGERSPYGAGPVRGPAPRRPRVGAGAGGRGATSGWRGRCRRPSATGCSPRCACATATSSSTWAT